MAQPSPRIPAWKRLGLKLQKHDQSGDQDHANVSQVAEHQHDDAIGERGNSVGNVDVHLTVGHAQDGKPGLGKRKHQNDPAKKDQTVKKSKKHSKKEIDGHAGDVAAIATGKGNDTLEAPTSKIGTNLKGDPNYRKKKGQHSRQNGQIQSNRPDTDRYANASPMGDTPLSPEQLDPASDGATLLVSTETDFPSSPARSLSPRTDRRKSVTFTPDTKTTDGNSASNLFKKWAQEQKGPGAEFSPAEVAQFTAPPKVHPANDISAPVTATASKTRKKDPSRYLDYLSRYHKDRGNWKFNKAIQNDVLDNSLNVFRIPEEHSEALIEYVKGLQGAGVIERLKQRCETAIEEIDAADEKEKSIMDDVAARKAAQEEALQERLTKERKRRRLEGDIENMIDHPYTEGYIRRMKKGRAKALLAALNLAAPTSAPSHPRVNGVSKLFPSDAAQPLVLRRDSKKRKRRAEVSSDESSDSSSSEESSSEEDESSDDASESSSGSDSSNDGETERENDDSKGDSDSTSSSESDSTSSGSESEDVSGPSSEESSSVDSDSD